MSKMGRPTFFLIPLVCLSLFLVGCEPEQPSPTQPGTKSPTTTPIPVNYRPTAPDPAQLTAFAQEAEAKYQQLTVEAYENSLTTPQRLTQTAGAVAYARARATEVALFDKYINTPQKNVLTATPRNLNLPSPAATPGPTNTPTLPLPSPTSTLTPALPTPVSAPTKPPTTVAPKPASNVGKIKETVMQGGYLMTVNTLEKAASFNPAFRASSGNILVAVEVVIESGKDSEVNVSPVYFSLRDNQGGSYVFRPGAREPGLKIQNNLPKGAKQSGWIVFETSASAKGLRLEYSPPAPNSEVLLRVELE